MYTRKEINLINKFNFEKKQRIDKLTNNYKLKKISKIFLKEASKIKYEYNYNFLGIPIIQYPQDIIAVQELIWSLKPDLIIETGIGHGGSAVFYASLLQLIDFEKPLYSSSKVKRKVFAIDIDIRSHNLKRIKKLNLSKYIKFFEGSSINYILFEKIKNFSKPYKKILVTLDSNHTCNHVFDELKLYSQLVTKNSYIIVFDTGLNFWGQEKIKDRDFSKYNNPLQAVKKFLKNDKNFKIDNSIDKKLFITSCESGFIKRIK